MSTVGVEGRIDAVRKKAGKKVVMVVTLENAKPMDIADLAAMANGDPDRPALTFAIHDPQADLNLDGPVKRQGGS